MFKAALILFIFLGFSFQGASQESINTEETNKNLRKSLTTLADSTEVAFFDGKYEKVIEYNVKAIQISKKLRDTLSEKNAHFELGAAFFTIEDYEAAKPHIDIYKEYAEKTQDPNQLIKAYTILGAYYSSTDQPSTALDYLKKALPISEKLNDSVGLGMLYYNITDTYVDKKDVSNSALYLEKVHAYFNTKLFDGMLAEYHALVARYELLIENPQLAAEHYLKTIEIAEKDDYPDQIINGYKGYGEALYRLGDIDGMYNANAKFQEYNSKKFELDKIAAIQNAMATLRVGEYKEGIKRAKLEKELSLQKANQSRTISYVFIGAAAFLAIFLGILLHSFLKRKALLKSLRKKNQQYLIAKEKSEQLALAKNNFFATVSHELRTPLYGVVGLSTMLLEDISLKHRENDLKHLQFSANYLLALINDVLQISKIESKTLDETIDDFDLKSLINSITNSFEYLLIQNKNELNFNFSDNIPNSVIGNRTRLSQILMNLIGNASKFTNNGKINISVREQEITEDSIAILFVVSDTGIGIPKNKQEYVFEEFHQLESSQYKQQGSGLGLPIVKKLLEASGSTITLESEFGKGSKFSFVLNYEISKTPKKKKKMYKDDSSLKNKTILVVDDNRINQIVTKKILEKHGLKIQIAENGDEAINQIKKSKYDLILMDINMPGKNGLETTEEIRKFDVKTPIIALTALEVDEMWEKIIASGMNDIIVKPFDVEDFLNTILKNLNNLNENFETNAQ